MQNLQHDCKLKNYNKCNLFNILSYPWSSFVLLRKKFGTKQISLLISIIEFAGIRKEKALTVYQITKS